MSGLVTPSKEEINELPQWPLLPIEKIHFIGNEHDLILVKPLFVNLTIVGLDTESKPCFTRGKKNLGPQIIQLATENEAFVFQVKDVSIHLFLQEILQSPLILKVGFGLRDDARLLKTNHDIKLTNFSDVDKKMQKLGYKNPVGMINTMAILFNCCMQKPKKIVLSNWARKQLSVEQLSYAGNDAHISLLAHQALELKLNHSS